VRDIPGLSLSRDSRCSESKTLICLIRVSFRHRGVTKRSTHICEHLLKFAERSQQVSWFGYWAPCLSPRVEEIFVFLVTRWTRSAKRPPYSSRQKPLIRGQTTSFHRSSQARPGPCSTKTIKKEGKSRGNRLTLIDRFCLVCSCGRAKMHCT
jgi:hypothetical protein